MWKIFNGTVEVDLTQTMGDDWYERYPQLEGHMLDKWSTKCLPDPKVPGGIVIQTGNMFRANGKMEVSFKPSLQAPPLEIKPNVLEQFLRKIGLI